MDARYLLWINNLTWLEQFKQTFLEIIFSAVASSVHLRTHTAKVRPRPPKSFNKKIISIKLSLKWGTYQPSCWHWFLTLWKDWGQSTPLKNFDLRHWNWKIVWWILLKYPWSKQNIQKMFLQSISQLGIMVCPTIYTRRTSDKAIILQSCNIKA